MIFLFSRLSMNSKFCIKYIDFFSFLAPESDILFIPVLSKTGVRDPASANLTDMLLVSWVSHFLSKATRKNKRQNWEKQRNI